MEYGSARAPALIGQSRNPQRAVQRRVPVPVRLDICVRGLACAEDAAWSRLGKVEKEMRFSLWALEFSPEFSASALLPANGWCLHRGHLSFPLLQCLPHSSSSSAFLHFPAFRLQLKQPLLQKKPSLATQSNLPPQVLWQHHFALFSVHVFLCFLCVHLPLSLE